MKKFLNLLLSLCFLFISQHASAVTWTTINYGYWNDPAIWAGGVSPGNTLNDTIVISHPVVITTDLHLQSGTFFSIEINGGICGHHNMTVDPGAVIHMKGLFELDELHIPGGFFSGFPNGNIVLTVFAIFTNGGSMNLNGCTISVGPWFDCMLPQYGFLTSLPEHHQVEFLVSPNPANDFIFYNYQGSISKVIAFDMKGSVISLPTSMMDHKIPITVLNNGIYVFEFYSDDRCVARKKLLISRSQ